jgi:hypothetical protein
MALIGGHLLNEPPEVGVHLRSPTGNVHRPSSGAADNFDGLHHCLPAHNLSALRAGIDMTMLTALIAKQTEVDLYSLNRVAAKADALSLQTLCKRQVMELLY